MVDRRYFLALSVLCLVLAGCAPKPAEVDADRMGRTLIDAIQRDDWPLIDANLGSAMAQDPLHAPKIAELRKQFPPEPPWSIKLLKSAKVTKSEPERSTLSYLYTFADCRLQIDLVVEHYGWRRVYEPAKTNRDVIALETEGRAVREKPPKPKPGERPYHIQEFYKLAAISVVPAPRPKT